MVGKEVNSSSFGVRVHHSYHSFMLPYVNNIYICYLCQQTAEESVRLISSWVAQRNPRRDSQGPRLMRHSVPLELFLLLILFCHWGWKRVSCCSSVWLSCTWRLIFMFFLQRTCRFCVKIKSQPTLLASGFRQDYAALPFEVSSIFYWWVPDATFLESFFSKESFHFGCFDIE